MKTKFNGILTLFLAFVVQIAFAQERTISGTVSDESGPLPGVSVMKKGTMQGAETNFDGLFSIKAKTGDVLVFSFVGMEMVEKKVGASNKIDVLMKSGNVLEEVIVTAFGIKREKKEVAYQTQKVDSKEILAAQPQSTASALAGKVAGLQINVEDNGVNPKTKVILRGLRSITQNNQALFVIDGSISSQGAFNQLNPADISSINVLKGATAAALYGSRAGNGALVVTTKRGKAGEKFTIGLNSSYTLQEVAYMPEFQQEFGMGWQGNYYSIENTNWGPRYDGTKRRIGPVFSDGTYQTTSYSPVKNNLRDFYNTGSSAQNTVYFSGSDEKNKFYFSLGNLKSEGIVPNDEYSRNTFRANVSRKMGSLEILLNTSYTTDKKNVVGSNIGAQNRPLYWFILNTPSNIDLKKYKDITQKYASPGTFYNGYYENPYYGIQSTRDIERRNRFLGNVTLAWEATDWLNFTGRMGLNRYNTIGKEWRNAEVYSTADMILDRSRPNSISSFVTDSESQSTQITLDFLAEGNFNLTEDFSLKTILGASSFSKDFRESAYKANNLSIPGFYNLSNTTGQLEGGLRNGDFVDEEQKRTYGAFGELTFGYKDYLFLNLAGRNDWTSTLDKDNRSYFYPSAGLSFTFTDAFPSIKGDIINYGKFTSSFSKVFNDISAYTINERYTRQTGFPYSSTGLNGYVFATRAVSKGIKKEGIGTMEFGLNLGFLKNRITLDASYYRTTITDLITSASTAPSVGANTLLTNIGEVKGSGIELSLGTKIIKSKKSNGFNWETNINYTSNEQKVTKITDNLKVLSIYGNSSAGIFAVEGEEFPQVRATSYVRNNEGKIVINPRTGNPEVGGLKSLGKTTPDYILGLTNSFSYKGFTLSATMDYRTGHVFYSQLGDRMEFTGRSMASVSSNRQDFVFPNSVYNTSSDPDKPVYVDNTNIQVTGGLQDFWTNTYNEIKENYVIDATSFKLREMSLRYQLPQEVLSNTGLSKLTLGIVGRNLLTYLPKENTFSDPEFNNDSGNGIGYGGYTQSPPTRSYGLSLNVEF